MRVYILTGVFLLVCFLLCLMLINEAVPIYKEMLPEQYDKDPKREKKIHEIQGVPMDSIIWLDAD